PPYGVRPIAQLRDLEHVREALTSTTVATLADLPFFFVFLGVMWILAGPLALVPLGGLVLMALPGVLVQPRLREYANASMREASLRNAMLVEAVQGMDDIKSLQAEQRFLRLWNHYNAVTAMAQLKLRRITNGLTTWGGVVQMLVFAAVVTMGAPMVIAGEITTGGLVAASMLGSRMIAPMAQLTQVLGRLQQARVAARSVDAVMALPVDDAPDESRVHLPVISGHYQLRDVTLRHGDENSPVALSVKALDIRAGERIAVLGRNGAGKSTLLRALAGLLQPSAGEITLDNVALAHIDPADLRRDIGFVGQDARLFHGSLRDNLLMGAPDASHQELTEALALTGALGFVRRLPAGLDHVVGEGGAGFSQGQRQLLLLTRQLLRNPQVALLDEPTASLDEAAERELAARLGEWARGRTLVMTTHRLRLLEIADRVIVLDEGRVVLDAPRAEALQKLGRGPRAAAPARQTKGAPA
ncbi:ATP-binding cassette domain-containing protein, partial [Camelimonas abortus]